MPQKSNNKFLSLFTKLFGDIPLISQKNIPRFMVALQAVFGLLWIEGASWKLLENGKFLLNFNGLAYWVKKGSEYPVFGPYKWLIDSFILPNIKIFFFLVVLAELTIGVLLVFGKFVRFASILAIGQTIAITLSVFNAPNEWRWSYIMMLLFSLLFFVIPTTSKWPNRIFKRK
jgi:thiosulfate dehydrogenase (quinone) large subunit